MCEIACANHSSLIFWAGFVGAHLVLRHGKGGVTSIPKTAGPPETWTRGGSIVSWKLTKIFKPVQTFSPRSICFKICQAGVFFIYSPFFFFLHLNTRSVLISAFANKSRKQAWEMRWVLLELSGRLTGETSAGAKGCLCETERGNKHFKEKYLAWNSQERVRTEENLK